MSKKNNRKTDARHQAFIKMEAERRSVAAKKKNKLTRPVRKIEQARKETARKPKVQPIVGSAVK